MLRGGARVWKVYGLSRSCNCSRVGRDSILCEARRFQSNLQTQNQFALIVFTNYFRASLLHTTDSKYVEKKGYLSHYSHERMVALREARSEPLHEFGTEEEW